MSKGGAGSREPEVGSIEIPTVVTGNTRRPMAEIFQDLLASENGSLRSNWLPEVILTFTHFPPVALAVEELYLFGVYEAEEDKEVPSKSLARSLLIDFDGKIGRAHV